MPPLHRTGILLGSCAVFMLRFNFRHEVPLKQFAGGAVSFFRAALEFLPHAYF